MSRVLTCGNISNKLVNKTVRVNGCVYTDLISPKGNGVIIGIPPQIIVANLAYSSSDFSNTDTNSIMIANRPLKVVSISESHRTVSFAPATFSIKKQINGGGIVTLLTGINLQTPAGEGIVYDNLSNNELNEGDALFVEYVSLVGFAVKQGIVSVASIIL